MCPLFEPFLSWLYTQDLSDLSALPAVIDLPDAEFAWAGYRRPGSTDALWEELLGAAVAVLAVSGTDPLVAPETEALAEAVAALEARQGENGG